MNTFLKIFTSTVLLFAGAVPLRGQAPDREALANNPVLFLETARKALKWDEPAEPAKIVGPGWNYTVRLYRPRPEIQNGSWVFPEAQPAS